MPLPEGRPGDRRGYRGGCGSWDPHHRNLRHGKSLGTQDPWSCQIVSAPSGDSMGPVSWLYGVVEDSVQVHSASAPRAAAFTSPVIVGRNPPKRVGGEVRNVSPPRRLAIEASLRLGPPEVKELPPVAARLGPPVIVGQITPDRGSFDPRSFAGPSSRDGCGH
jgi:hypothetical protein